MHIAKYIYYLPVFQKDFGSTSKQLLLFSSKKHFPCETKKALVVLAFLSKQQVLFPLYS